MAPSLPSTRGLERGFHAVGLHQQVAHLAVRGDGPTIKQNGSLEYVPNGGSKPKRASRPLEGEDSRKRTNSPS